MMTPKELQQMIEASHAASAVRMDRFEEDLRLLRASIHDQKANIDALMVITDRLLKISEAHLERTKRLESRVDSVEEMTKVLRELLESTLRRPDKSGHTKT